VDELKPVGGKGFSCWWCRFYCGLQLVDLSRIKEGGGRKGERERGVQKRAYVRTDYA